MPIGEGEQKWVQLKQLKQQLGRSHRDVEKLDVRHGHREEKMSRFAASQRDGGEAAGGDAT
jgi:hypothetical protein